MYEPLLLIHSWTRWIVFLSMIALFGRCLYGWISKSPWAEREDGFLWAVDQAFGYQILFGGMLWLGISPFTKTGFMNPSEILANPLIFFWTVRHGLSMILAFGIFQIFKAKCRKAPPALAKYRLATLGTGIALAVIISAIPWPGLEYGRPLVRWFL